MQQLLLLLLVQIKYEQDQDCMFWDMNLENSQEHQLTIDYHFEHAVHDNHKYLQNSDLNKNFFYLVKKSHQFFPIIHVFIWMNSFLRSSVYLFESLSQNLFVFSNYVFVLSNMKFLGLILTNYCMRYLHAVPFLRN